MSIKDYVVYKLHNLRDLDYRYNLNLGAKFRPGEVVDFEYLSAAAKKLRYGARKELSKKIEKLKLMHSNFQLRMYSKMQYEDDDDVNLHLYFLNSISIKHLSRFRAQIAMFDLLLNFLNSSLIS